MAWLMMLSIVKNEAMTLLEVLLGYVIGWGPVRYS